MELARIAESDPERLHRARTATPVSRLDEVAVEDVFYSDNVKTALKIGHARGVILLAAADAGLPIAEYSPREVKQAVVGSGSASKEQVQFMVKNILTLKEAPHPYDATDALAVALCHVHRLKMDAMIGKGR